MKRIIHWFRRDLRLSDNTALAAAVEAGERVIPVFILEYALRSGPDVGGARLGYLLHSVRALDEALRARGTGGRRWEMEDGGGRRAEVGSLRVEEAVPEDPGVFGHPVGHAIPEAGERAALETLRRFLGGPVLEYGTTRD